jgi:putative addiction module component (TIGR02574 family)
MTTSKHIDFSQLTIAKRIRLAQELQESVCSRSEDLPLSEAERLEIERRWEAFEAGRITAAPWDEVRNTSSANDPSPGPAGHLGADIR